MMKLNDLFESVNEALGDLAPGDKRVRPDLTVRDLQAIQDKIWTLKNALNNSRELMQLFKQDQELQKKLTQLAQRIQLKMDTLEKVTKKPTTSQKLMLDILDSECSEFLTAMKQANRFMYRGIKNMDVPTFEGHSRAARRSKDSYQTVSDKFDLMLSALGVKALRSNSIFTSSSTGFAGAYGTIYMIFPKNGFDFLQTNKRDLILDTMYQLTHEPDYAAVFREFEQWAETHDPDWTHSSMRSRIRYGEWRAAFTIFSNELPRYVSLGMPDQFKKLADAKNFVSPESVQAEFEPNTTDLVSAIKSGHEVLFRGEYWALKSHMWQDILIAKYFDPTNYQAYY